MKVLTLTDKDFAEAARRLKEKVSARGIEYDLLVGIATGGEFVADEFDFAPTYSVKKQRASSEKKEVIAAKILPLLPRWVCNLLRIAEAKWLERSHRKINKDDIESAFIPEDLKESIGAGNFKRILVVDDAVDSGETLLSVVKGIKELWADLQIYTAVMTVTTKRPLIRPDVTLWNDGTLIRFPWSKDMKKR